jgi:formate dehydrogenase assembly factor FdhD
MPPLAKNLAPVDVIHATVDEPWADTERVPQEVTVKLRVAHEGSPATHEMVFSASPADQRPLIEGFLLVEGIIRSREEIAQFDEDTQTRAIDVLVRRQESDTKAYFNHFWAGTSTEAAGESSRIKAVKPEPGPRGDSDLAPYGPGPGNYLSPTKLREEWSLFAGDVGSEYPGGHEDLIVRVGLVAEHEVVGLAEDIRRENAFYKLVGICHRWNFPMLGSAMFTTGKMTADVVIRAHRVGLTAVVSRTVPTAFAIRIAKRFGIALAAWGTGPDRRDQPLRVFSAPWRFV